MKRGIDISYHQGNIDFVSVKVSGIEFVIIREGYRNTTDQRFFEYVQKAKEAGLIILGVYHFSYALNKEEARKEAQFCIENMRKAGLGKDVMVFYDFEYDTVTKAANKGIALTNFECNEHTTCFCEEVKKLGYVPGIYTNKDYYKNWYFESVLQKYPIWLADYSGGPDFDCIIQQYSSSGKVPGIKVKVDLNYFYGDFKINNEIKYSRQKVVELANSWIGLNERDGSYKKIIDIYNSFTGEFPRGIRMQYGWSWCACTWSALAVALGYTEIMPIEISCGQLIERAKEMGVWVEDDSYRPLPGDAILYDWGDNGNGDNLGWPDHVGVVTLVCGKQITVVEGNKSDAVGIRTIDIDGKFIRGFITPKFKDEENISSITKSVDEVANEVIDGLWGNGLARKDALTIAGYDYEEVQNKVNEILHNRYKEQVLYAACRIILGEYGETENAQKIAMESIGLNYVEVKNLADTFINLSKE